MAATTPAKRHRSFSSKSREHDAVPLTFDLEGEEFEAHPQIPGAVLLDFVAAAGEDGTGTATAIYPFFEAALLPESNERFVKIIRDPEVLVDLETLVEIAAYLVEEYSDSRPSKAS